MTTKTIEHVFTASHKILGSEPESEPAQFLTFDAAEDWLIEELEQHVADVNKLQFALDAVAVQETGTAFSLCSGGRVYEVGILEIEADGELARRVALATELDCALDEVATYGDDKYFEAEGGEYMVLTDEEANEAWDESLDSYLDDCILGELEGPIAQYFDREAWKRDARHDGRGHSLNSYDGSEEGQHVAGSYLYIYRVN